MKVNKKIIITVCTAAAVASSVLAFHYSHTTPDLASKTPEQIRRYFDSNEFRNLDERTRRERIGNIMQAVMTKRAEDYCALPAEKQIAYLDKIIDDMESRRNQSPFGGIRPDGNRPPFFGGMPPDGNRPGRRQQGQLRRRPSAANMRARSEQTSAQTRLNMAIFRRDMRKRMEQRGISFPQPRGPEAGPPP